MDLAQWLSLQFRNRNLTYRKAAEVSGVQLSAITGILKGTYKPGLGTLARFSEAFDTPLWQLVEMCGYSSGVDQSPDKHAERVANLLRARPELESVLDRLALVPPDQAEGVLRYLEAVIPQ